MHILINNSGWLAIFFVWTMVWLPSKLSGIKNTHKSETGNGTGTLAKVFNMGMILAGLSFLIFGNYIGSFSLWTILFSLGCIGIMTSGLIPDYKNKTIHNLGVRIYFALTSLGGVGIMLSTGDTIGAVPMIARATGVAYIYLVQKDTGLAETLGFSFATIWVIYLYTN